MWQGMKSVMVFDSADTDEQTANKFIEWRRDNSSIGDKYVPNAVETRKMLARYDK